MSSTKFLICNEFMHILDAIRERFKKNLIFVTIKDNIPGILLKNGSWNGGLGLIDRNEVDIILARFSHNEERQSVADFPYLTPNNKLITILSSPQVDSQNNILTIFNAFQLQVWISLIIAYILIFTINTLGTKGLRKNLFIAIDYFVVLLGKGLNLRHYNNKYLLLLWTFTSMIINYHFISDIQALLVSQKETRIETFQQLIDREDVKILVVRGSNAYKLLEKDYNVLIPRVEKIAFELLYTVETVIKLVKFKYALVSSNYHAENIVNYYNQYYLIKRGDNNYPYIYGFPIRKTMRANTKLQIRTIVKTMHQFGIFNYNLNKYVEFIKKLGTLNSPNRNSTEFLKNEDYEESNEDRLKLRVNDLFIGFIIMIFGSIISIVVFAVEHILKF